MNNKLRILHIGALNRNIGDTAAMVNARKSWIEVYPNIEWHIEPADPLWNPELSTQEIVNYFKSKEGTIDAVLIGGGGLIEYSGYNRGPSGYKLPFNKYILSSFNIPVFIHGVGVNIFRGVIEFDDKARQSLQETIDYSAGFSVRNDGSLEKLKSYVGVDTTNVTVIPDPGLLYGDRFKIPVKKRVTKGGIQPAFNGNKGINHQRYRTEQNLEFLSTYTEDLLLYPHIHKDLNKLKATPVIDKENFENKYRFTENFDSFLELYKKIDYVLAFRGHGQMITLGMNIPGIYVSTQDKVRDFSLNNGLADYNVDILEPDWQAKLKIKVNHLKVPDSDYLRKWYEIRETLKKDWYKDTKEFITKSTKGLNW